MKDRELLDLAARAAGFDAHYWHDGKLFVEGPGTGISGDVWNPLEDDGDALRLAVKLGLTIEREFDRIDVYRDGMTATTEFLYQKPTPTDPDAATRRAIVRAAAELAGI